MKLTRRSFLRLVGLTAASAAAAACQPLVNRLAPAPAALPAWSNISSANFTALNRLTFGVRVEECERAAQIGLQAWVEEQLAENLEEDPALALRLLPFQSLGRSATELADWSSKIFGEYDRLSVPQELRQATLVRQVYSRRQLYEVLVEFWNDHFNICVDKGECWYLKTVDDRAVIRAHALGNFGDLLQASAHSPAMLVYLDNQANHAGQPNENYAREVMELHSLGVRGGYSQADVMELARCLTGWGVKEHFWRGDFAFQPELHDRGTKRVLGLEIAAGGEEEAGRVLERLAGHPSTAAFLSAKLARRLLADDPDPELVAKAAAAFTRTRGDIRSVLRVLLLDGGLQSPPPKFKRPLNFVTSALRMLNAQSDAGRPLLDALARMGQAAFAWPTPDGYPDTARPWQGGLMERWRLALGLAHNELEGTRLDLPALLDSAGVTSPGELLDQFSRLLLGDILPEPSRTELAQAFEKSRLELDDLARTACAGLLASPAFQYR